MRKILLVSLLVVVSLISLYALTRNKSKDSSSMQELNIYVPFVFTGKVDPRAVYTVGDQVVAEHVFAFHSSSSIKKSVVPLFSKLQVYKEKNLIEIIPVRTVITNDGRELTLDDVCGSLRISFAGTQHTRYATLVKKIECKDSKISILMTEIPVNVEYWLKSIDFAIYESEKLPISQSNLQASTGPYSVISINPSKVELLSNANYPKELKANDIQKVNLVSYSPLNIKKLVQSGEVNLAYLYGYAVDNEIMDLLKNKMFKVQIFPNEWLVYLGFKKTVDLESRKEIASRIDMLRDIFKERFSFGELAFSITPSDRPYSLTESAYAKVVGKFSSGKKFSTLKIATLDEWASIPLFKYIIEELVKEFEVKVKIFTRKDMSKIYSEEEADMFLSPMGISPSDPLGNLSFLMYEDLVGDVLSETEIVGLYKEKNFSIFKDKIIDVESRLLKSRALVPIAHFPGLVIESSKVSRDESISWDWGIQAWAYKIN